ncbi:phosphotransferase [Bacillus sp. EB600]|uniref:phosphotransferase n=1 Tax=Bacillus sp. EB600 TaxID=2806345 RepID=UPI00210A205C|nr:phosphotransferase [Bacillus sp. EB600]MCQ6282051.1 phosphotransferase [Bacillus sp. EB600]
MIEWQGNIVLENGQLNEMVILKREPLYTGTNGKVIERFFITPNESFIFKPLTNDEQIGKEVWVQENILSVFPDFYPKIIAKSSVNRPENSWIVYSDLGPIKHEFTLEILKNVTKQMVWWHSLPIDGWKDAQLNGPKPKIETIKAELFRSKDKVIETVTNLNLPKKTMSKLFLLLEKKIFSKTLVLSHGDLHLGNYGTSQNKLVIIDWEYAHLNTRFWDLYHLIDLSHPLHSKTVTSELRNKILTEYYDQASTYGIETNRENFKNEYYLFSATFSLWMIMLIEGDLKRKDDRWPEEILRNQLFETAASLFHCIEEL